MQINEQFVLSNHLIIKGEDVTIIGALLIIKPANDEINKIVVNKSYYISTICTVAFSYQLQSILHIFISLLDYSFKTKNKNQILVILFIPSIDLSSIFIPLRSEKHTLMFSCFKSLGKPETLTLVA